MKRSGVADLPLHGGRVPVWLAERMARLGREIVSVIVHDYGASEVLTRLSDPFWFQAFGAVLGMDWHSSGITTSVMNALKQALNPIAHELGIYVCGGRGRFSRQTPQELLAVADHAGLDGDQLVRASRLSAKVDNTCVQDGFQLYLHTFIVTRNGEWAVVQQGMNDTSGLARRYHWHSANVRSFVSDPHAAIVGANQGTILNLSDSRAEANRAGIVELLSQHPDAQLAEMRKIILPGHHEVRPCDVNSKRLAAVLAVAYESQKTSFADALLLPGVGPRTLQALSLVSEVIHGSPARFADPARFAFAHGGKDGHPAPVPLKIYDQSIAVLRQAVGQAKINRSEKLEGLKKLHNLNRYVEERARLDVNVSEVIARERAIAPCLGGRTVFDDPPKSRHPAPGADTPEMVQPLLFR